MYLSLEGLPTSKLFIFEEKHKYDEKSISSKMMTRVIAFTRLSNRVLIPLLIGYVWMIVSFAIEFLPGASGAILVGVCIIADIQWNGLAWRQYAQSLGTKNLDKGEDAEGGYYSAHTIGNPMISGGVKYVTEFDLLRKVKPSRSYSGKGEHWYIYNSLQFFDSIAGWIIGVSAIIGTLVWGYADWALLTFL